MRLVSLAVVALALAASGCGGNKGVKVWRDLDRAAVNYALARQPAGTVVTDRQLELADKDATVFCEDYQEVGTHITQRRCRTKRVVEEEQRNWSERWQRE